MNIRNSTSIIYLIILYVACDRVINNNDPYEALYRLHSKSDFNTYVIIDADGTDKFIQFYLSDSSVYFDIPIYSEVKDKYINSAIHSYADKNENGLWEIYYVEEDTQQRIETIFRNHNIKYALVKMRYIDPTFFNQTNTTGWIYSLKGPVLIDKSYIKSLIDIYFTEVYELPKENLNLKIEENVFQP